MELLIFAISVICGLVISLLIFKSFYTFINKKLIRTETDLNDVLKDYSLLLKEHDRVIQENEQYKLIIHSFKLMTGQVKPPIICPSCKGKKIVDNKSCNDCGGIGVLNIITNQQASC